MTEPVSVRQMTPADGPAFVELTKNSPDTGAVAGSVHYQQDAYAAFAALHEDFNGFVAMSPDCPDLLGSIFANFGECIYEGELRAYALLHTLAVHCAHRQRGIATQLSFHIVDYARQRLGPDGVIYGYIQKGNTGSIKTAQKWYSELFDGVSAIPFKLHSKEPAKSPDLEIRPAESSEYERIAECLNTFYEGYNFYEPQTGQGLAQRYDTLTGTPFRHYLVASSPHRELLAGLEITETFRFRSILIEQMPLALRAINALVKIVPPDGVLRELSASKLWYIPGQRAALRALWETARWMWYGKATSLLVRIDGRSPLHDALGIRAWTLKTQQSLVIYAPISPSKDRTIYPIG